MAEKTKSINLLPQNGDGYVNQFLSWALTVGRLLIILTETLALATFLYRFSIDMRIVDLNDVIKNQRIIVQQFKTTEDNSRNLQARLAMVKLHSAGSEKTTTTFSDIIEMGRGQITFKNIALSDGFVRIEMQAPSSNPLSFFVSNLKKHPEIVSVSIDTIENKTTSAVINMNISAKLKGYELPQPQSPGITTNNPSL